MCVLTSLAQLHSTSSIYRIGDSLRTSPIKWQLQIQPQHEINLSTNRTKILKPIAIDSVIISNTFSFLLRNYENQGYPFASITLDSFMYQSPIVYALAIMHPGPYTRFYQIQLEGDIELANACIYGCTGLYPQKPYSEINIQKASSALSSLDFISVEENPKVQFSNSFANVILTAKRLNTNQLDLLIGIAPNASNSAKTVLTGQVSLFLQNTLHHADEIQFEWQNLGLGSQQLKLNLQYPYIFATKLSPQYALTIYRQDSSLLNVINALTLSYRFKGRNSFDLLYEQNQTNDLSSTTHYPSSATSSLYGIGCSLCTTDHVYNPSRGYTFNFKLATGIKKFTSDSIQVNTSTISKAKDSDYQKISLKGSYYIPLTSKHILQTSLDMAYNQTDQLTSHDFLRIGGFNNLRGFNENIFQIYQYGLITIGYRYRLNTNSFFTIFTDQALLFKDELKHASGYGTGISLKTKNGILKLYYALGLQQNQTIQFRNSKLHIGFVNTF